MRTVLTGGTGVIGRAAVTALRDAGHEVVVVSRSAANTSLITALGATPVTADLFDVDSLAAAYEGADAVVNLATSIPIGAAAVLPGAWTTHFRLRTEGVGNVVAAARQAGVRRIVQESVSFLYADHGDEWISEQCHLQINKLTEPAAVGESLVQDYTCGSRVGVVLRFGVIVGDDPQTRFWLRQAAARRPIGLGHPSDWAHVVHTDDLGTAVACALRAPSGVYNVGAEPVQRHELVRGYADTVGVDEVGFMGRVQRKLAGKRLEPLSRSLRVSSDHFIGQTGWQPARPKFDADWLSVALGERPAERRLSHLSR